jgi:hypothetical protein
LHKKTVWYIAIYTYYVCTLIVFFRAILFFFIPTAIIIEKKSVSLLLGSAGRRSWEFWPRATGQLAAYTTVYSMLIAFSSFINPNLHSMPSYIYFHSPLQSIPIIISIPSVLVFPTRTILGTPNRFLHFKQSPIPSNPSVSLLLAFALFLALLAFPAFPIFHGFLAYFQH